MLFSFYKAQTSPTYLAALTDKWIENSVLDKTTNNLYLCYSESGEIKKLNLSNPSAPQVTVLSGLSYPTDAAMVGNKLYFVEATTALDANDMPIQNTGKLSYIDASQANPSKVTILTNLNIPMKLAAGTDFLIISENNIPADPDDFGNQFISKINLTGTISKTPIVTRTFTANNPTDEAFEHFEVLNNNLYANSYNTWEVGYFYKIPLDTKIPEVTHSFTQNSPFTFGIFQNTYYFGNGSAPGSSFKTPIGGGVATPISTSFSYNNTGAFFDTWNFDNDGNAYLIIEQSLGLFLFKYTKQQLLKTSENAIAQESLNIYPNPTSDVLQFSKPLQEIKVYDKTGKLVLENKESSQKITVKNLPTGNYFISGKDILGNKVSAKFIKK